MLTVVLSLVAGSLIGLSLGALGAGGSVLAVPALVYGLGQSPGQATTGSLLVVAVTSALAGSVAHRRGTVNVARGLVFALVASAGAVGGARLAAGVDEDLLMAGFGVLMVVVTVLSWWRRGHRPELPPERTAVVTFRPHLTCHCLRALTVLVTATAVGLLTGVLGVGGGFLVVPALTLALGMGIKEAVGTSLVVITLTSTVALTARLGHGMAPDPLPVLLLASAASAAAWVGVRWVDRLDTRVLTATFAALTGLVGVVVSATSLPAWL